VERTNCQSPTACAHEYAFGEKPLSIIEWNTSSPGSLWRASASRNTGSKLGLRSSHFWKTARPSPRK
jgi:hypothetical protein